MDSLLVGVTIVSLLLAFVMSAVAWTLWQNDRQRSAARAEALEALAFSDHQSERAIAPAPRAAAPTRAVPVPAAPSVAPVASLAVMDDREPGIDDWDYALGDTRIDGPDDTPAEDGRSVRARAGTDEMFHAAPGLGAAGRLWLALAAVALVITAGVVAYRALHSPEIVAAVAASRSAAGAEVVAAGARPLELLSLRHAIGPDGTFTVTGLVQNPIDGESLDAIEAVVYLFDNDGRYFASGKAPLEVPGVEPGDESPFTITVPAVTVGVSRYRVGFRHADGKVLAHVDRRGQLPRGTSGDALDVQPALVTPAGAVGRARGVFDR
jgi:hypothetical protein